jgi:hypothetical protein
MRRLQGVQEPTGLLKVCVCTEGQRLNLAAHSQLQGVVVTAEQQGGSGRQQQDGGMYLLILLLEILVGCTIASKTIAYM